jgi:hypothetical protein
VDVSAAREEKRGEKGRTKGRVSISEIHAKMEVSERGRLTVKIRKIDLDRNVMQPRFEPVGIPLDARPNETQPISKGERDRWTDRQRDAGGATRQDEPRGRSCS